MQSILLEFLVGEIVLAVYGYLLFIYKNDFYRVHAKN